jgi:hypothetical protein
MIEIKFANDKIFLFNGGRNEDRKTFLRDLKKNMYD